MTTIANANQLPGVIHVGSHIMSEIMNYVPQFGKGIFIEAQPPIMHELESNLAFANRNYGRQYRAVNALITNEDDMHYDYHTFRIKEEVYSGQGSIYPPGPEGPYPWGGDITAMDNKLPLKSVRMATLIKNLGINMAEYPILILDVQGAELEVLKSFDAYIDHVRIMVVEISKTELYKGGVLFDELDAFITGKGFAIRAPPESDSCDVIYDRKS